MESEYLASENVNGDIFECSYLTYLEMSEVVKGRSGGAVWQGWVAILAVEGTGAATPLNRIFGLTSEGRQRLVSRLRSYAQSFDIPTRPVTKPKAMKDNMRHAGASLFFAED